LLLIHSFFFLETDAIDEYIKKHFPEESIRSYHRVTENKPKKMFKAQNSRKILVVGAYRIILFGSGKHVLEKVPTKQI
jgi:hypothetical protein